jgi:hypothetical protein
MEFRKALCEFPIGRHRAEQRRAVAEAGELGKMNHIQWLSFDPGAVLREFAGRPAPARRRSAADRTDRSWRRPRTGLAHKLGERSSSSRWPSRIFSWATGLGALEFAGGSFAFAQHRGEFTAFGLAEFDPIT